MLTKWSVEARAASTQNDWGFEVYACIDGDDIYVDGRTGVSKDSVIAHADFEMLSIDRKSMESRNLWEREYSS